MNTSHPLAKYLSSQQMENSEIQKRIVNLGKALVQELNLDPGVDTLARWMAHYVAEQIEMAEQTDGIEKKEIEERCFNTILKLWKHRSVLPRGSRPLENFDPILNVLARLDPENERKFFFEHNYSKFDEVSEEVKKWLDIAQGVDEAARVWLGYIFERAALGASDESTSNWLENATPLNDSDDVLIIKELLGDADIENSTQELHRIKQEKITSNIKKLEVFAEINKVLLSEFNKELEKYS